MVVICWDVRYSGVDSSFIFNGLYAPYILCNMSFMQFRWAYLCYTQFAIKVRDKRGVFSVNRYVEPVGDSKDV